MDDDIYTEDPPNSQLTEYTEEPINYKSVWEVRPGLQKLEKDDDNEYSSMRCLYCVRPGYAGAYRFFRGISHTKAFAVALCTGLHKIPQNICCAITVLQFASASKQVNYES